MCESGELIVHLTLIPMEEREVRLSASVTATGMTDEEADDARTVLVQPLGNRASAVRSLIAASSFSEYA